VNRRIGGIAGLAFLVLALSTMFLAPAPPGDRASAAEMAEFVRDHHSGIELQAVVFGVAVLGLVAFTVAAHDLLVTSEAQRGLAHAAWAGVTLLTGGWVLSFAIGAGLGLNGDRLSDESIMSGMVGYGAAASVGGVGSAVLLAAFAALGQRSARLPGWVNAIALLGAVINVAALATYATDSDAVFSLVFVGFGALALWMIAVSVALIGRGAAAAIYEVSATS
jgi:hypothetical protein